MSGADVSYKLDASKWIYALGKMVDFADGRDLEEPSKKVTKLLYDDVKYTSSTPTRRRYNRTFNLLGGWNDKQGGSGNILIDFQNTGVPYSRLVMSAIDQASIHAPKIYWGDRTIEKTGERVTEDVPKIFASHFIKYIGGQ